MKGGVSIRVTTTPDRLLFTGSRLARLGVMVNMLYIAEALLLFSFISIKILLMYLIHSILKFHKKFWVTH
jgi:hypothetical protein